MVGRTRQASKEPGLIFFPLKWHRSDVNHDQEKKVHEYGYCQIQIQASFISRNESDTIRVSACKSKQTDGIFPAAASRTPVKPVC